MVCSLRCACVKKIVLCAEKLFGETRRSIYERLKVSSDSFYSALQSYLRSHHAAILILTHRWMVAHVLLKAHADDVQTNVTVSLQRVRQRVPGEWVSDARLATVLRKEGDDLPKCMAILNYQPDIFDLEDEKNAGEMLAAIERLENTHFRVGAQMDKEDCFPSHRELNPLVLPDDPVPSLALFRYLAKAWETVKWEFDGDAPASQGLLSMGEVLTFSKYLSQCMDPLLEEENAETVMGQGRDRISPCDYESYNPKKFAALVRKYRLRMQFDGFQFTKLTRLVRAFQAVGLFSRLPDDDLEILPSRDSGNVHDDMDVDDAESNTFTGFSDNREIRSALLKAMGLTLLRKK